MQVKQLLIDFPHTDFPAAIHAVVRKGWIETGIQEAGVSMVFRQSRGSMFAALRRSGEGIGLYQIAL